MGALPGEASISIPKKEFVEKIRARALKVLDDVKLRLVSSDAAKQESMVTHRLLMSSMWDPPLGLWDHPLWPRDLRVGAKRRTQNGSGKTCKPAGQGAKGRHPACRPAKGAMAKHNGCRCE